MSETSDTKPHLALSYIDSLSVWEICHRYWGYHPDETDTKCLPLDVQDFMRQMLLSNGFEFHDANGKEFLDIYIPFVLFGITYPRLEKIERQVTRRVFKKEVLDRLYIEKDDFAKWIIDNRHFFSVDLKLPAFWFTPYDIEYFEDEYGEKYNKTTTAPDNDSEPVESQQKRAALAKYAAPYKIKQDYIRYWLQGNYQLGQEGMAAVAFYTSLSADDKRLIAHTLIQKNEGVRNFV